MTDLAGRLDPTSQDFGFRCGHGYWNGWQYIAVASGILQQLRVRTAVNRNPDDPSEPVAYAFILAAWADDGADGLGAFLGQGTFVGEVTTDTVFTVDVADGGMITAGQKVWLAARAVGGKLYITYGDTDVNLEGYNDDDPPSGPLPNVGDQVPIALYQSTSAGSPSEPIGAAALKFTLTETKHVTRLTHFFNGSNVHTKEWMSVHADASGEVGAAIVSGLFDNGGTIFGGDQPYVDVTPTDLPPGDYWFVIETDNGRVSFQPGDGTVTTTKKLSSGAPTTHFVWPGTDSTSTVPVPYHSGVMKVLTQDDVIAIAEETNPDWPAFAQYEDVPGFVLALGDGGGGSGTPTPPIPPRRTPAPGTPQPGDDTVAQTLLFPLQITPTGRIATVDQDSPADIASCVTSILRTPQGWRLDDPDFGRPTGLVFQQGGTDPQQIADSLTDSEPRATGDIVVDAILGVQQTVHIDPTGGR